MNMKSFFLAPALLFVGYTSQGLASYEVLASEQYREYLKENTPELLEYKDKENATKSRQEIKEKGYHDTYSNNAASLINIKERIKEYQKTKELNEDPSSTGIRENVSDIPLSFPYSGMTSISADSVIGYAPAGGFEDGSWTGVGSFFDHTDFGTCRITVLHLGVNGKSVYDKSKTSYEVNNKPTTQHAEGNSDSGFFYTISWTGERYDKFLNCANNDPFNPETMGKLIAFAKIIDEDAVDSP